jgi:predicted small lipoprotein YifL
MARASLRILGMVFAVTVVGCGQKGPLFLPPPVAAPQSTAPTDRPAERPTERPYPDAPATTDKR